MTECIDALFDIAQFDVSRFDTLCAGFPTDSEIDILNRIIDIISLSDINISNLSELERNLLISNIYDVISENVVESDRIRISSDSSESKDGISTTSKRVKSTSSTSS